VVHKIGFILKFLKHLFFKKGLFH